MNDRLFVNRAGWNILISSDCLFRFKLVNDSCSGPCGYIDAANRFKGLRLGIILTANIVLFS